MHTSQDYFWFVLISEQKVHLEALDVSNFACIVSLQAQFDCLSSLELHDLMNQPPYISELSGIVWLPGLPDHH